MARFIILLCLLFTVNMSFSQELKVKTDKKGRCGYEDSQGNIVVQCKYETAYPFYNGNGKVGKGNKYGIVNTEGKEIIPVKYDEITDWSDKLYRVKSGDKYGLISNTGKIIVKPKYSFISRLNRAGKALLLSGGKEKKGVITGAKMGLINVDVTIIVDAKKYDILCEFNAENGLPDREAATKVSLADTLKTDCSYISCFAGKKNVVLDSKGNALTPLTDKAVYLMPTSGMSAFSIQNGSKKTSGYWDIEAKKNILISDKAKSIVACNCNPFTGDIARVDNPLSHTSYFVDKHGKKISDEYSRTKYKGGYWIVYGNDKSCALLCEDGHFIYEKGLFQDFKFPDVKNGVVSYIPAKKDGRWGLADIKGGAAIPFEYDDIDTPQFGLIYAVKEGKKGVIDVKGNVMVPFEYNDIVKAKSSNTNNIWVCKDDKLFYNFDVRKQSLIGDGMAVATGFEDGLAWVVPKEQTLKNNSIHKGLKKMYEIKLASKEAKSFGVLVDTVGCIRSHIPVPQNLFSQISSAIKENGGTLTDTQEKNLLLLHTRAVRVYPLGGTIDRDEWDY